MRKCLVAACFASLATTFLLPPAGWGQQKPPPPNPNAPNLAPPFPLGMQRGTTSDVVLTGTNLANPKGVWAGFPGTAVITKEDKNGTDNAKLKV
ncbi:MAG: hypothetical protein NZO58_10635, partial [Gemmataceae bacterium]|nr:hypothetical protein [Gemmataceae bacterium]